MEHVLENFVHKRVRIRAMFVRYSQVEKHGSSILTALVHDPVLVDTGELIADHAFMQAADTLKAHQPKAGEVFECRCRVHRYKKHNPTVNGSGVAYEVKFGLELPTEVRFPDRK